MFSTLNLSSSAKNHLNYTIQSLKQNYYLTKVVTPGFMSTIATSQSDLVSAWSNEKTRAFDAIIVPFLKYQIRSSKMYILTNKGAGIDKLECTLNVRVT